MNRIHYIALLSVVMSACRKETIPPVQIRLQVTPGEVRWGDLKLPMRVDHLAEQLEGLTIGKKIEPKVCADFSGDVRGERMGEIFGAIIHGGSFAISSIDFNINGHRGGDFHLTLPTDCCDPVPFEPYCDEWGGGVAGEFRGTMYLEFDVGLHGGEFTAGGEPLEPEELTEMLLHRRGQAREITVYISMGSEDTARELLPLLAACQNLEMHFTFGAEQREAEERQQRRLAKRLMEPNRRRSPLFCPGSPFTIPDVRSDLKPPPLLPERWLMSGPMGIARGEGGG